MSLKNNKFKGKKIKSSKKSKTKRNDHPVKFDSILCVYGSIHKVMQMKRRRLYN